MKKTINAIKASRKWRQATSRKLASMSAEERVRYLNSGLSEKLAAFRNAETSKPAKRKSGTAA